MCLRTILHSKDLERAEAVGPEFASLPRNRSELFAGILKKKKKKVQFVWVLEDVLGVCSMSYLDWDSSEPTKLTSVLPLKWKSA